jgi:UDP-glucose 4-epimerase
VRVLVTGGAGYIGSHAVKALAGAGHGVVVLDDLSAGHPEAVRGVPLVTARVHDTAAVRAALRTHRIDAVMHFAAWLDVGESVRQPAKYYENNVTGSLALLEAMIAEGVGQLVFSSTCAVYGEPRTLPLTEDHPTAPINAYGESKLVVERALGHVATAHGLRAIALRYFNAAGADPSGELGERHDPETHLIPLVLQAASGRRPSISVFGNDWPTRDGSCVRDYIHVSDLCVAHQLALDWLAAGGRYECFNLGNGEGATVLEVIEAARRVTGRAIKMVQAQRRVGDPPSLVADASKARRVLGWQPARADIEGIVRDAWKYEQRRAS